MSLSPVGETSCCYSATKLGQKAAELGMSVDALKHEIDAGTPLKSIERKHEADLNAAGAAATYGPGGQRSGAIGSLLDVRA